jgi:hypothetical protein
VQPARRCHARRGIALGIEADGDEPDLSRQRRIGGERAVEAVQRREARRAPLGVGTGGVDERDDGEAVARKREQAGAISTVVEQRVIGDGVDRG